MTDLIKRLRDAAQCVYDGLAVDTMNEAADALESLTRELAAAKVEIEGLRKENAQLTNALNPRLWSVEMDHSWHRAIPNLHKAFADLKAAAIAEKSSTNS